MTPIGMLDWVSAASPSVLLSLTVPTLTPGARSGPRLNLLGSVVLEAFNKTSYLRTSGCVLEAQNLSSEQPSD